MHIIIISINILKKKDIGTFTTVAKIAHVIPWSLYIPPKLYTTGIFSKTDFMTSYFQYKVSKLIDTDYKQDISPKSHNQDRIMHQSIRATVKCRPKISVALISTF